MERNSQGFSMFELLVALLLLLFIFSGLAVGMRDYLRRQKSLELHTLARQILETEKARLLNLPSNSLATLDRTFRTGICNFNGTCNFDPACFNEPMQYTRTNCQPPLRCIACLKGKEIVYGNCSNSPYTFYLSYTLADVYTPNPDNPNEVLSETPIGVGICMKVEFIDPAINRTQIYKALVLKMEW
jgi:type II secretory pathway pseudopilin PulG